MPDRTDGIVETVHQHPGHGGLVFYRLLELAAGHDPVRYRNIVAGTRPRKIPPTPPAERGHPPSLERPPAERPWRAGDLGYSG
jgi:hypothetical protein